MFKNLLSEDTWCRLLATISLRSVELYWYSHIVPGGGISDVTVLQSGIPLTTRGAGLAEVLRLTAFLSYLGNWGRPVMQKSHELE